MKVLVDTCIWSQVLRRRDPDSALSAHLAELIREGRVILIGPIRQEILSGITEPRTFQKLKDTLSPFEDFSLKRAHFEKAAEFANISRKRGIQGSTTDFLICAVAALENFLILTTDKDFEIYAKFLPVKMDKSIARPKPA